MAFDPMMSDAIIDGFAGGGGASTGIEWALGRSPDYAYNHDADALAVHEMNHPQTEHCHINIWQVDPMEAVGSRRIALAWFSPDCTHHSKAKGGKPVSRDRRDLAWIPLLWAKRKRPDIICIENVEEFADWGPLIMREDGREYPDPERKGETFAKWVKEFKKLGYKVEWKELRACDYGAPTIRKRLFIVARCDGQKVVWPAATHGAPTAPAVLAGKLLAWRTAASDVIDWSIPCPSIFMSKKEAEIYRQVTGVRLKRPLEENTMARIAKGVKRYVIDAAEPFIVPVTHAGDQRVHSVNEPVRTLTAANRGEHALVTPFISRVDQTSAVKRNGVHSIEEPIRTLHTSQSFALVAPHLMTMRNSEKPHSAADEPVHTLTAGGAHIYKVAAFLAQHNTGVVGHDARKPTSTLLQRGTQQQVVAASLLNMKGSDRGGWPADTPTPTICANGTHVAEVRAFLMKYYGSDQDPRIDEPLHTVTTKDRFGLVTVYGEPYQIVDIGMRMLTPREMFRAQGFNEDYIIDRRPDGTPVSKTTAIRLCGNSVSPPVARALVAANAPHLVVQKQVAA